MARSVVSTRSGCSPPPGLGDERVLQDGGGERHDRELEPDRAAGVARRRLEGPQAVGHQHHAGGHGAQVAQEVAAVHGQGGAHLAGLGAQRHQLALALAHHDEQGPEAGHDEEPLRDGQPGGGGPGHRSQHEPGGHGQDVEDGLVLEPQRVAGGQDQVADQGDAQVAGGGEADDQRGHQQAGGHGVGHRDGDQPGGDGPVALGGVEPVALDVAGVVEQVGAAGGHAEGHEGQSRPGPGCAGAGRRRPPPAPRTPAGS